MSSYKADKRLNPDQLSTKYRGPNGTWGEHPLWPVADWREEISNDDTRIGYWEWVEGKIDMLPLCVDELREWIVELQGREPNEQVFDVAAEIERTQHKLEMCNE